MQTFFKGLYLREAEEPWGLGEGEPMFPKDRRDNSPYGGKIDREILVEWREE